MTAKRLLLELKSRNAKYLPFHAAHALSDHTSPPVQELIAVEAALFVMMEIKETNEIVLADDLDRRAEVG